MKPSVEKLKSITDDAMYTLEEAAALCGVTSAGVRAWSRRGKVKLVTVGCRLYITGAELKKAIQI